MIPIIVYKIIYILIVLFCCAVIGAILAILFDRDGLVVRIIAKYKKNKLKAKSKTFKY
jgi:ABC-type sugar transport system permease subunit